MKKLFYSGVLFCLAVALPLASSCTVEDVPELSGVDCSVISWSLTSGGMSCPVLVYDDSLVALPDYNFDFNNVELQYEISEGALIEPDPLTVTDWSVPMTFKVTSSNGEFSKDYSYTVHFVSRDSRCDEDMYFTSQQELDEFGASGYTSVRSITVNGSADSPVTDLSPLNSIKKIDHNLTIKGYQGHDVILDGLLSVSTVDINSDSVRRVSFNSLTTIDNLMLGYLNEEFLYEMATLRLELLSFESLREISDNFVVYIQSCKGPGFPILTAVYGDMIYVTSGTRDAVVENDMSIFPELRTVNNLQLGGMSLMSMEGAQNLKSVTGLLKFEFVPEMTTLMPFCPDSVGIIQINSCQKLVDLDAFSNLKNVTTITVSGVPNLESLDGLSGIKRIESGFFLRSTNKIVNLDALSGIEYIGRTITLRNNRALEDFSGLRRCLESFEGVWDVQGNKLNPSIDDILNGDN